MPSTSGKGILANTSLRSREVGRPNRKETIVQRSARRRAYAEALALRGKLDLQIDLDVSRGRSGR